MKHQECAAGYLRVNELMIDMINAVESRDKLTLIKRAQNFLECTEQLVGTFLTIANVSDAELDQTATSDAEDYQLLEEASAASIIRTSKVN